MTYSIIKRYGDAFDVRLTYQSAEDRYFMRELYKKTRDLGNVTLIDELMTPDVALDLYTAQNMIISNRLHCVLFAYAVRSIGIALTDKSKHRKLIGSLRSYNMDKYVLDCQDSIMWQFPKLDEWLQNAVLGDDMYQIARQSKVKTSNRLVEIVRGN